MPPGQWMSAVALLVGVTTLSGCQLSVNPYTDELACQQKATPSVAAARAVPVETVVSQRSYEGMHLDAKNGTVTHGPLYFEDRFEKPCPKDETFAWTGKDYLHVFYGPARFLLNAVLLPVDAVFEPPWSVLASGGQSSPCPDAP